MTRAKNMGKWDLEVEKGVEDFEDMWRREDKHESDFRHKREVAASRAANQRAATANTTTPTAREEDMMEMTDIIARCLPGQR